MNNTVQIGVFSVSDITTDPTTDRTPSEHERIKASVAIAKKAEDVGLDVYAIGEHHNPPFFSSSPTTTLSYIAAQTERIHLGPRLLRRPEPSLKQVQLLLHHTPTYRGPVPTTQPQDLRITLQLVDPGPELTATGLGPSAGTGKLCLPDFPLEQ